jgi:ABC-type oligopeptide transport system substrate-binding subunit
MDIRCTDFGGWPPSPVYQGGIYDIERNGWGADFAHPDNQNRDLFACGAGNNSSRYCNPVYDALLNRGAEAASYAEALPFYQQAERMLVQDAPVLFLRHGEAVSLVRPWVTGYVQTASDHQNIGDVFYESIRIAAH